MSPVATHVERVRDEVFEVHVSQGANMYRVRMRAVRGATLLLWCRTKAGRAPAGNRRADVERTAIAAVQL